MTNLSWTRANGAATYCSRLAAGALVVFAAGCGGRPLRSASAGGESASPRQVSFPTSDSGIVYATMFGGGQHAVVLGSNGCLAKEGWEPEARTLAAAGFRALAIDFRGSGQSRGGRDSSAGDAYYLDVLAAVRFLRENGASRVSVVGASCAGDAAADAAVRAQPGEIDGLVLLASGGIAAPERMKGRKLFVVTRDDANDEGPRLPRIRAQYERTAPPKEFLLLEGSAHAQRIFRTDQGPRLMREILRFLARP